MIDAKIVIRSLYKIRYTCFIDNYIPDSSNVETNKLTKHRINNNKKSSIRIINRILFYRKFYKQRMRNKNRPVYSDDRKFIIGIYVNLERGQTSDSWYYEITDKNIKVENSKYEVRYNSSDGLSNDEFFNFSLEFNIHKVLQIDEVNKIRNFMKENKKYRKKRYILHFSCDDKILMYDHTEKNGLSKL